jgi:hypothetical protein
MKRVLSLSTSAALAGVLLAAAFTATEAGAASRHVVRPNAAGGTTATNMRAVRGPGGGYATRAGTTSINPDGSASHRSGFAAAGTSGSAESSGSASRDASGNVTQSRSTTATSAATGNSVQSSTSYNSATGLTHSATCYSAAGAVIPCR